MTTLSDQTLARKGSLGGGKRALPLIMISCPDKCAVNMRLRSQQFSSSLARWRHDVPGKCPAILEPCSRYEHMIYCLEESLGI
jgi:hypothetical protein